MTSTTLPLLNKGTKRLWKTTIALGAIAAVLGLALRYFFVAPIGFNFKYLLHAHSHTMLLGWLLGGLILLIYQQWNIEIPKTHQRLFYAMAACVVGMLFSFPFQGYAAVSITFSTLHLWLSYVLLIKVFKLSHQRDLPGKLVRTGIVLFFISTIGPYSLGPMMALEMKGTPWYDQAIFFYLHFLYNGAFFFFILAWFIEKFNLIQKIKYPHRFYYLMAGGTLLTWFHKLDYSFDFWWIHLLAGLGSVAQLIAGLTLLRLAFAKKPASHLHLILIVLFLKWVFQILGSFPAIADEAVHNRFILIAYLHFIFLGIFTPLLWDSLKAYIAGFSKLITAYWVLFVLTEIALVGPSLQLIPGFTYWPQLIFVLYAGLVGIWCLLGLQFSRNKKV